MNLQRRTDVCFCWPRNQAVCHSHTGILKETIGLGATASMRARLHSCIVEQVYNNSERNNWAGRYCIHEGQAPLMLCCTGIQHFWTKHMGWALLHPWGPGSTHALWNRYTTVLNETIGLGATASMKARLHYNRLELIRFTLSQQRCRHYRYYVPFTVRPDDGQQCIFCYVQLLIKIMRAPPVLPSPQENSLSTAHYNTLQPLNLEVGALYWHLIPHKLLASVQRTVGS